MPHIIGEDGGSRGTGCYHRVSRELAMRIDNDLKLDFDDVLIRPKRSEAPSRASVKLERE
jgi:hypothetical protein